MITNNPMKNSQITIQLYDRAPLTKERNGIIDNLNTLLNEYNTWRILTENSNNPFELSMKQYKIQASDSNAFITTANIQYMRISWGNRYHAFYWVNKINRSSNDVITLDIELDFLNTLHNGDSSTTSPLLSFSPLSSIERQHENRFKGSKLVAGTNIRSEAIDKVNENVNVALYHLDNEQSREIKPRSSETLAKTLDDKDWYLVYATQNIAPSSATPINRIRCFLMPSDNTGILIPTIDASHTLHNLPIATMESLVRTSKKIVKIIRCPYCPVEPTSVSGGVWTFPQPFYGSVYVDSDLFTYDGEIGFLVLDLTENATNIEAIKSFERYLDNYANTNFNFTHTFTFTSVGDSFNEDRNITDPKLHHSEFYGVYFVYDSSVWKFKPELIYSIPTTDIDVSITYNQSSSVDSALLFRFSFSTGSQSIAYISEENYPCMITANRQNEVIVYNDDYMDYIKNGYNYDKTKQTLNAFVGLTSSAVSLGTSLTKDNPVATIGSTLALGKAITSVITSEIDMQKNLHQMSMQSFNVSGVNDSSLFANYGNSKLSCVIMQPIEEEQKRWNDIFHFFGYNRAGVLGTPNVTSRVWFNYLKGEILLANAEQIPVWLYDKVKSAYREGVTYFHCHQVMLFPSLYKWDLKQEKENYETFLLDL